MDISFFVSIFLGLVLLVYWMLKRNLEYWKNRNVPYVEPEFFYGNARGLSREYHTSDFFKRMYLQLKPLGAIGGIHIYMIPTAIVTNLDLVKNILMKDFNYFPNRGSYYNAKDDPISENLMWMEDEPWKNLRRKLSPTFSTGKLKFMFGTISEIGDSLVEAIRREAEAAAGQIDVRDVLSCFATDVIASTAFGINCDSLRDQNTKFHEIGQKHATTVSFVKRMFLMRFPDWGRKLHIKVMSNEVSAFYMKVVAKTIKSREDNSQLQRDDYMDLLIKLKNSSGPDSLTFNQVAAQCALFFLAGFDNNAALLNFCMYELSIDKVIQQKARESVMKALEKNDNNFTYDSLHEMTYLEQCINEALRKYPTIPRLVRQVKHEYKVPNSDIVLERGTSVVIPIYGIHWDPEIYPQPEKYDPDRFTSEEIDKRHPLAFLPFGDGPRGCIGQKLALIEVKVALAKILMNFEMNLNRHKTSVPLRIVPGRFVLFPDGGINIHFEKL